MFYSYLSYEKKCVRIVTAKIEFPEKRNPEKQRNKMESQSMAEARKDSRRGKCRMPDGRKRPLAANT